MCALVMLTVCLHVIKCDKMDLPTQRKAVECFMYGNSIKASLHVFTLSWRPQEGVGYYASRSKQVGAAAGDVEGAQSRQINVHRSRSPPAVV